MNPFQSWQDARLALHHRRRETSNSVVVTLAVARSSDSVAVLIIIIIININININIIIATWAQNEHSEVAIAEDVALAQRLLF